jgi:hypothetical protein
MEQSLTQALDPEAKTIRLILPIDGNRLAGLPTVFIKQEQRTMLAFELCAMAFGVSKSQAKREILGGAFRINDIRIDDPFETIHLFLEKPNDSQA